MSLRECLITLERIQTETGAKPRDVAQVETNFDENAKRISFSIAAVRKVRLCKMFFRTC